MSFVKVTRSGRTNNKGRLKSTGGTNKTRNNIQNCYNDISDIYFDLLDRCNERGIILLNECEPSDFFHFINRYTPRNTPKNTPRNTPNMTHDPS